MLAQGERSANRCDVGEGEQHLERVARVVTIASLTSPPRCAQFPAMRQRLILPTTLVASVSLLGACASSSERDAGSDVALDRGADTLSPLDALTDAAPDAAVYDLGSDCVQVFFSDLPGLACRPRRDAAVGTVCPDRVCNEEGCPAATCESCRRTILCVPDPAVDAAGVQCEDQTCDPQGCPRGCLFA
jgi:hypothetical protein